VDQPPNVDNHGMGIRYRIDEELKLVIAVVVGRVTDADVLEYAKRRHDDPEPRRALDEVMDLRASAMDSTVTGDAVRQLARFWRDRSDNIADGRLAIIAPGNVSFGMSRMYQFLRDDGPDSIRVFRDPIEALRWLEVDDAVAQTLADRL